MLWLLLSCVHAPPAPEGDPGPEPAPALVRQGISSEIVIDGPLRERLSPDDGANLVILYGGEERGSMEECGCPQRPRGGLARQLSYFKALQQADSPVLFVNGGYWLEDAMGLDGETRADVPVLNRWMVAGMEQLEPHALNISYNDTAGLTSLGEVHSALPLVSANVEGGDIQPSIRLELGEISVGITGITTPGVSFLETPGFEMSDPFRSGKKVLEALSEEVDFTILLAYGDPKSARRLAQSGLVDVVIDTNLHRESYPPVFVGEALWVRSHFQTMRLGELRLGIEDGEISWAVERKIDLDRQIPDHPEETILMRTAAKEIKAIQMEAFGREL
jgi:2',3'-cyclic-nucleotide 2'-phosphodiesterase (5'-nucleotidase family)